jgi:hypothetical protein
MNEKKKSRMSRPVAKIFAKSGPGLHLAAPWKDFCVACCVDFRGPFAAA